MISTDGSVPCKTAYYQHAAAVSELLSQYVPELGVLPNFTTPPLFPLPQIKTVSIYVQAIINFLVQFFAFLRHAILVLFGGQLQINGM